MAAYRVNPALPQATAQPAGILDLLSQYGRRSQDVGTTHGKNLSRLADWTLTGAKFGGVGAGVGAAAAGIAALIGKRAPTARTDFAAGDARNAVGQAYQQYLGRAASPAEIASHLRGQGLKAGDRWVGERGLRAVLEAIKGSDEAQQVQSRGPQAQAPSGHPLQARQDRIQAAARQMTPGTTNLQALLQLLQG